jgi:purine-binding chemotaxis protein CheW
VTEAESLQAQAASLRQDFDLSFAAAPSGEAAALEDLLAVRVGGDPYAIRLREIAGIVSDRPIVPLPTGRSDVLGLAGIRGGLIPVFSLSSLLGYAPDANATRWMVLCRTADPIALAFGEFEGHLRIAAADIYSDDSARGHRASADAALEIVHTDSGPRPLIDIARIVAAITRLPSSHRPAQEQDT